MEDGIPRGLQHCHKTCCEKGGCHGRWACMVQRWHHYGDVVFWTGGLVYDTLKLKFITSRLFSSSISHYLLTISTTNYLLQSQDLRVGQVKELYIRLIQENSIENSVQDCLPYIQILNSSYKLFLVYPK